MAFDEQMSARMCSVHVQKPRHMYRVHTARNRALKIRCGWAHFNDFDASGSPVNAISKSILTMIRCWCCCYFCWSCHTKTMIQITLDDNYNASMCIECRKRLRSVWINNQNWRHANFPKYRHTHTSHIACNNVNVNNDGRLQSCFTLLWT